MTPEFYAIIAVGVSLGALILSGQRALRSDLAGLRSDLHSLAECVARLEGAFPFIAAQLEQKRPAD